MPSSSRHSFLSAGCAASEVFSVDIHALLAPPPLTILIFRTWRPLLFARILTSAAATHASMPCLTLSFSSATSDRKMRLREEQRDLVWKKQWMTHREQWRADREKQREAYHLQHHLSFHEWEKEKASETAWFHAKISALENGMKSMAAETEAAHTQVVVGLFPSVLGLFVSLLGLF